VVVFLWWGAAPPPPKKPPPTSSLNCVTYMSNEVNAVQSSETIRENLRAHLCSSILQAYGKGMYVSALDVGAI
jgi:hypothetical protein